jgi:ATP phosphoribosyltransferase
LRKIVVALPKGSRLFNQSYEIFKKAGHASRELDKEAINAEGKHLEFVSDDGLVVFLLVRIADIPQYVDKNWADVGISAFDCYREYELSNATLRHSLRGDNFISDILPDLRLCGNSRFCVAGRPEGREFYERCKKSDEKILEAATRYPNIAARFLLSKNIVSDIITISGSSELMPKHSGVNVIFDIVETGRALTENGLIIYEEAMPIQTRVLVSKAALKYDPCMPRMIGRLDDAIKQGN